MENRLIQNNGIKKILEKYRTIWALDHMSTLANWDLNTYMPDEGSKGRAEALSKIASLSQKLFLEKDFVELINNVSNGDINEYEKGIIRILKRYLKFYTRLPKEFIEEFIRITSEAHLVWRDAKKENNFSIFEPYLTRIVDLAIKKAEFLGYKEQRYDALLDEFEEGLTTKEVEEFFSLIKGPVINLIKYITDSSKYKGEHSLEKEKYGIKKMKSLNNKILNLIHFNGRIDVSPHPFSTNIGPGDFRITNRYQKSDFAKGYGATIHEFGHALYDLQCDEELNYTPISGGKSYVLQESQSRFWENYIGNSLGFIKLIYPEILKLSKEMKKYSPQDIYEYFNLVKPGLIRTDADEVTYHLHVLIRFELEKALIEGKISIKNLPGIWNEKYEKYLGIRPNNDREGILQDVHWSSGYFGYFPTYSIGSALSSMWKYHLEKDLGNINELMNEYGIRKIQEWLKNRIHKYGSTYIFRELVKKATGEDFNSNYFLNDLEHKYNGIY